MKIEFNLVNTTTMNSGRADLISRKRILTESEDLDSLMSELKGFILSNSDTLLLSLNNQDIVNEIVNTEFTVSGFFRIKTALVESGLDVLVYSLDEAEVSNPVSIPSSDIEVNILDYQVTTFRFIPSVTRVSSKVDEFKYSDVLSDIISEKGLDKSFGTPLDNKVLTNLKAIKNSESITGVIPSGPSSYLDEVLRSNRIELQTIFGNE